MYEISDKILRICYNVLGVLYIYITRVSVN